MKKTALLTALLLTFATMASAQTWIDITDQYVKNPGYDDNTTTGWTIMKNSSGRDAAAYCMEFWQGTWNIYQTIPSLPAGRYRVSVQGFFREGALDEGAVRAHDEGTENLTCFLYANDNETPLVSTFSCYLNEDVGGCKGVRYGGGWNNVRYYPNSMESGAIYFQRGYYDDNKVEVTLQANQSLTFGLYNDQWNTNNWVLFDNWRLEYYGNVVALTSLRLNKTRATLKQGDQLQLTVTAVPANATYKGVTFSSSNEAVATVDADGLVTTLKPGITTITAQSTKYDDISARCIITVEANEVSPQAVIINEVQQANVDMFIDPSFNYGGWIELYNSTDAAVALDGLYVQDDQGHRFALKSSRNGTIPAKGFLALWFDHFSWWTPKTTNFKLDCDGGYIAISNEQGTVLSEFNYPPAITRTSYARTTDGGNTWAYTDQPTPNATNTTSAFAETRLEAPTFNKPGGFFDSDFTAGVMNIPSGATIRYTTDGSTPTLENGETSSNGRFTITQTTVLRVRYFKNGMLSSPVTTRTFIRKDRDYTLPVLSLVSDPKNLTGPDYGIFVQGNGNGRPGNGQAANCNWNMDWDRPANIEFITPEKGVAVFNQEVGIEPSGGWSRAWSPHSFNIKANKVYEGVNRMDYQFFPNKPFLRHKGLKVRNGGNDTSQRIKDGAIQEVVRTSDLYVETQSFQPVHLYQNGRYIGVLNLREPNNKNYGFANYGIGTDDDEMDQWKMSPDSGYVQQVGTRDVFDEWYSLSQNAGDALVYERIKQIVDIEEMCNYLSVQFYLGGNDYPKNNIKSFRERSEGQSNSRFRAILFDLDHAFNTGNGITWFFDNSNYWTYDPLYGAQVIAKYGNRISGEIEFVTIIKNMLQNEEFKKQLVDQCCIVTGSVFEPTRAREVITDIINRMAADGHSASGSGYDVIGKISTSRQNNTFNNIRNYFGLDDPIDVTLSSNLDEAGLLINGLNVPTGKFAGKLFAPVAVTASAPAGYRFKGWQSNQATAGVTIFSKGTDWNYYDQGSLDGEDWTASNYVNTWRNGNAPLGYFVGDNNSRGYQTTLDFGGDNNNKRPTYYFRKQVILNGAPKSTESFTLNWVADDGFIIYINGTEAGRYLMPAGNVSYNTFATTYANGNPDSGTMTLDASLFKQGTNTIAVELHNNAANSTDVMWDAELVYAKESDDNIASTEATYKLPENVSSITLKAIYEKIATNDAAAWDAHPVKINEVSADNEIYVSELYKKSDWIELYNTTDAVIDVAGMYLSDHLEEPEKWQIPTSNGKYSTKIPAHGHLIIWCDKNESDTQLHADFKLNNEDNSLVVLTAKDKSWADTLVYCSHDGYHTVGLYPDGGSQLYVMERPTIGKANILTTLATVWQEPVFEQPEPDAIRDQELDDELLLAFDGTSLKLSGAPAARLDIYNTTGQLVMTTHIRQSSPVGTSALPRGLYIARAKTDDDETTLKFSLK